MVFMTLCLKNEIYPRTYRRSKVKFFTPATFPNEELDENVIYINSEMVSWMHEATRDEIEDYFKHGGV